ncbi:MAG: hypothetical protein Q9195_008848 [Heterodermia aff. obscurata]
MASFSATSLDMFSNGSEWATRRLVGVIDEEHVAHWSGSISNSEDIRAILNIVKGVSQASNFLHRLIGSLWRRHELSEYRHWLKCYAESRAVSRLSELVAWGHCEGDKSLPVEAKAPAR